MNELSFERLHGSDLRPRVDELAALRIHVFRDWPYLYDGALDYEREYLQTYVGAQRSLAFLVFDGDALVGATTALPLIDEQPAFRAPLENAGFDPARVFYFGESLLLADYRGLRLGHRFFDEREAWARRAGGFETTCFCAVQRPDDHPARPAGYRSLDGFWKSRGYRPRPDLVAHYAWRDLGDSKETCKPLMFWTRVNSRLR